MQLNPVLIIGSGTMGSAITELFRNLSVAVVNVSAREFMAEGTLISLVDLNPWLVLECGQEEMEVKVEIINKISSIFPNSIVATGTSSLSVNVLANSCAKPDRFCGIHFMNPPVAINYVELVSADYTSPQTISKVEEWLVSLGRRYVLLPDSPGFLLNALLFPLINRAIYMLQDSDLTPNQIDSSLKDVCGHKMGPLRTADLIGLDVVYSILLQLHADANERNFRPAPLLKQKLSRGEIGKKTKLGFYAYE